ncbi:hypothetical protein KY284_011111 [Solanum tuberosum]|nr:hypothetical protein KY284_011111 [Solanum tuberosum]
MASENFVQAVIPRFDGHYDHWSMLMENFLRSKEYWQVVVDGIPKPTESTVVSDAQKAEAQAAKLKDLKAKNYLFQAIERSILETILSKDTSKQIWDSMKKKYQGSTRTKRQQLQALRSEFDTLRMKSGESVSDYFSRVMTVVNKMRIHGDKSNEVTIVEKILWTMTPKFNFVVCSIEESHDIDLLSIDELQSSLLIHEQKFTQQEKEEVALNASTDDRSGGQGYNKGNGRGRGYSGNHQQRHYDNQGRGKGRGGYNSKSLDKSKIECYRCHKFGHYKSECRTDLSKVCGEESNFAEQEEEEISLLMVFHMKEETNKNLWYLDSECNNHMSGDKSVFSDESFRDSVKFGNNSKVAAMGKGQI